VQAAKLLKAGRVVAAGATLRRWRRCPTLAPTPSSDSISTKRRRDGASGRQRVAPRRLLRDRPCRSVGTGGRPSRLATADGLSRERQRRIETSVLPLAEIEIVWSRDVSGRRTVVTP